MSIKLSYFFNGQPSVAPKFIDDAEFAQVDLAIGGFVRALSKIETPGSHERPTLTITFRDDGAQLHIGGSPAAVRLAFERLGLV